MKNGRNHDFFMNLALKEAEKAFQIDEVPVGAIVVQGEKNIEPEP